MLVQILSTMPKAARKMAKSVRTLEVPTISAELIAVSLKAASTNVYRRNYTIFDLDDVVTQDINLHSYNIGNPVFAVSVQPPKLYAGPVKQEILSMTRCIDRKAIRMKCMMLGASRNNNILVSACYARKTSVGHIEVTHEQDRKITRG